MFNFTITSNDQQFSDWLVNQDDKSITKVVRSWYMSKLCKNKSSQTTNTADVGATNTISTNSISSVPRSSYSIGLAGEQAVADALSPIYELDIKQSHAGDMIVKRFAKSVMVEVKNYTTAVPYKEVEKFYRDLDTNATISGGLFVSLKSQITKVGKVIHLTKRNHQYVVFLVNPDRDLLLSMIGLLFDINEYRVMDGDQLISEIDKLNELRTSIGSMQTSAIDLKANVDKGLDSLIQQINQLEYRFGKTITKLTKSVSCVTDCSGMTNDKVMECILSKFADSALVKSEEHKSYLTKYIQRFDLGECLIKGKAVTWKSGHSVNPLKTKTTITIEVALLASVPDLIKYEFKTAGEWVKVDIKPKNYPLLMSVMQAGSPRLGCK